jgi:hypothetical protein
LGTGRHLQATPTDNGVVTSTGKDPGQWLSGCRKVMVVVHTEDFDPYTASALTGLPLDEAERALETLLDAHLLQEPSPDRYRFHDRT